MRTLERQKALGVVPPDTELTERPDTFPAWDSMSEAERKLYARQMEVFAGFSENADWNVGRLLDAVEEMGELDNTLIIYIGGDNGASAEGMLNGTPNEFTTFNGVPVPVDAQMLWYPFWGSDKTFPHFAAPWAWAMDTPFKWTKQISSYFGGTRQGMAIAWPKVITDKGGAFNPATLARFDAVIWNNISGDVLTLGQRAAFKSYVEHGGAYVAMHGSAGDPVYFWDWYVDTLLGARFVGHPTEPQFQEARISVNQAHPLAKGLPAEWRMTDEWYSFKTNPRAAGANVLLTLDESSYTRVSRFAANIDMGKDHPLAWTNCIGKGRMFYSAIGHMPETYSHPQQIQLLQNAIEWAALAKGACR